MGWLVMPAENDIYGCSIFISSIASGTFCTIGILIISILNVRLFVKTKFTLSLVIQILSYITNISGLTGSIILVYKLIYVFITNESGIITYAYNASHCRILRQCHFSDHHLYHLLVRLNKCLLILCIPSRLMWIIIIFNCNIF